MRQYQPCLVPGLLQTEGYARAVLHDITGYNGDGLSERLALRLERQKLLRQSNLKAVFLLDEAVLHHKVGGPGIHRKQIMHLSGLSTQYDIRVLPFSLGGYAKIGTPFIILQFEDASIGDMLFLEGPQDDFLTRDDQELVSTYSENFSSLTAKSINLQEFDLSFLDG